MIAREWKLADRTDWPSGEWDREPDKMQWTDEATGLPCLIVRGPVGGLCGYVGVGPSHPWFRLDYSHGCPERCGKEYCEHTPSSRLDVHGGVTFSDACHEANRESFDKFRAKYAEHLDYHIRTAAQFPVGDSARFLRRYWSLVNDFEAWRAHTEGTSVCHLGGDFEPAWWFGFDCAHSGDRCPAMRDHGYGHDSYKNVRYVREQCASLALQLSAVREGEAGK